MEKKRIKRFFKLNIRPLNAAFEDSSIGPNLSPFMVREKINLFCNEFNEVSKNYISDLKLSIILYLHTDNTFFFIIRGSRLSDLLKLILNISSLSVFNENDYIYLSEFYDLIFYKYFFFNSDILYNSFILKNFLISSSYSIKNLLIKNEYFEE